MANVTLIGGGNQSVSVYGSGTVIAGSAFDNDTITLGNGSDTICEAGHATVHGIFGSATIAGGTFAFINTGSGYSETALTGSATLLGGSGSTQMIGGIGADMFMGGSGADTMTGGIKSNMFEFVGGGKHLITNFVSGIDHLYVEGYSLSYLQTNHEITTSGGSTMITLDGGKTIIELKGVTHLSSSDITTNKS